jgi:hypothetical protein
MIKAYCIESGGKNARFLIKKGSVVAGKEYTLDLFEEGTLRQTRLVRSLVSCFFTWMFNNDMFEAEEGNRVYNLSTPDIDSLYDYLKYKYGLGFYKLKYVSDRPEMVTVPMKQPKDWDSSVNGEYDPWQQIPDYVIEDFNNGNKHRIEGVLISWVDYSKKQRQDFIDVVFKLMHIFKVDNAKFREIKAGLDKIQKDQDDKEKRLRDAKRNNSENKES